MSRTYFGGIGKKLDWRKALKDEVDPDDEELEKTPQEIINLLGFDPKILNGLNEKKGL